MNSITIGNGLNGGPNFSDKTITKNYVRDFLRKYDLYAHQLKNTAIGAICNPKDLLECNDPISDELRILFEERGNTLDEIACEKRQNRRDFERVWNNVNKKLNGGWYCF